jgi:hypothetical protein
VEVAENDLLMARDFESRDKFFTKV